MEKLKSISDHVQLVLAPILVGLYPILFLYNRNAAELQFSRIVMPAVMVIASTLVLAVILKVTAKNPSKIGLSLSAFWLFFFFYGPFYEASEKFAQRPEHTLVLGVWALILLIILTIVWRVKDGRKLLQAVLLFGTVLVGFQLFGISKRAVNNFEPLNAYRFLTHPTDQVLDPAGKTLPNIYFIMPDSYPRSDTLKEYFAYDNGEFDRFLESKGFYLAKQSYANYNQTFFTMPAMLNMSYIKDLESGQTRKHDIQIGLFLKNKVIDYLKPGGYRIINNSTVPSTWKNPLADVNSDCKLTNEFVTQFSDLTVLRPFKLFTKEARENLRSEALCILSNITNSIAQPSPKFVFTHLYPPHPPYLFGANGEDIHEVNLNLGGSTRWQAKDIYISQLKYVNKRLTEAVDEIVRQDPESVIIIQSDHGTVSRAETKNPLADTRPEVLRERGRNYTAIRLPESCKQDGLYPTLTNVNTFRLVFNNCFQADYELLPDKIFYTNGLLIKDDITDVEERR